MKPRATWRIHLQMACFLAYMAGPCLFNRQKARKKHRALARLVRRMQHRIEAERARKGAIH